MRKAHYVTAAYNTRRTTESRIAEGFRVSFRTFVRKNSNLFGCSLTYSYLCMFFGLSQLEKHVFCVFYESITIN